LDTALDDEAAVINDPPPPKAPAGVVSMDVPRTGPGAEADADAELRELHRRAYGPHPDIQDDAEALARMIALEAAHRQTDRPAEIAEAAELAEAPEAPRVPAPPPVSTITAADTPSPSADLPSVPTRRRTLEAVAVGAAVALAGVLAVAVVAWEPPADAVMRPTGAEPDDRLLALLAAEGPPLGPNAQGTSEMQIDLSTLRAFGTYREVEVWSAMNAFGSPCLIGVHRATEDVVARRCMPTGAALLMDMHWDVLHGDGVRRALPEGHVLRFILRTDTVDVRVLESEGAG
jgi:hypothetical protein